MKGVMWAPHHDTAEMNITASCGTQGQGGVDSSPLSSVSPQGFRHFVTFSSEIEGAGLGLEMGRAARLEPGMLEPGWAANGKLPIPRFSPNDNVNLPWLHSVCISPIKSSQSITDV